MFQIFLLREGNLLEAMITPATLTDLSALGADILKGQVKGRVVVDVNA